jgi:NAD+ synthase
MTGLRITLAQLNPVLGDIDHNLKKLRDVWHTPPEPTDLIIFPELFLCGYPPEDLVVNFSFLQKIQTALAGLIKESANYKTAILVTAPYLKDGKVFNAAHFIENGSIKATICKHHLPNYGVFDEARTFSSGSLPEPVIFRGHKLGIMICEDMWHADVTAHLKKQGAEVLIVPNGSPFDITKRRHRTDRAHARIKESGLPLVYINQIGGQDDLVFDGHSFVMTAGGDMVVQLPDFEEAIHTFSFPLETKTKIETEPSELRDIYKALTLGLRDYVRKNNFKGILLGLSGGVDSALAAIIAADAIGAANVHCVMMPSRYTSKDSMDDAAALASRLETQYDIIPIEDTIAALHESLGTHLQDAPDITFENLQSRARGIILMTLSNASGYMVLTTGNKSEMAAGYATLYGDMCGGFNALKDVYKTQVYALCRWRDPAGSLIPERILTRAPSAELKDNQTDQDNLPPYAELDKILYNLIEQDLGIDDLVRMGHSRETVEKTARLLATAEYKRRQSSPGVKISPRSFGRERRYPMTNRFR